MPEVRRYGNRQVGPDALPGVRKSAAETETSTGVGLANAQQDNAEAIQRLSGTVAGLATQHVAEMQRKERDRADMIAVQEGETALGKWRNKRLYDPENGAFTLRGKDALPLPEQVGGEFKQVASEIEAGLSTDRQRAAFQRVKANYEQNLDAELRRHVFGEIQRYDAQTLQATEENASESAAAAAADPRRVDQELARGVDAIKATAPGLGMGPEAVQARVNNFTTKTHMGVIQQLVDSGDAMRARVYFEEKGDEITDPQVRAHLTNLLKVGTEQQAALTAADKIVAEGGTLTEQLAKAKDLPAGVRERVEARIEHAVALKKTQEREADENLLDGVYARVNRSGGELRLTPSEENQLGRHLPALQSYALKLAKGEPIETDQAVYYMLREAATTDEKAFVDTNLMQFAGKLSPSDLQELTRLKGSIRAGNKAESSKVLDDWRTEREVVSGALTLAGIDPTPKNDDTEGQQRVARFSALVSAEARRVQEITHKKLGNADLESIANRLLATEITARHWFRADETTSIEKSLSDIPLADLDRIRESLRTRGLQGTPETILETWKRAQRKGGK